LMAMGRQRPTKLEKAGLVEEALGLRESGYALRDIAKLMAVRHGVRVSHISVRRTLQRYNPKEEIAHRQRIADRVRKGHRSTANKPKPKPKAKAVKAGDNGNGHPARSLSEMPPPPKPIGLPQRKLDKPQAPPPPRPPGPRGAARAKLMGLADHTNEVWRKGHKTVTVPRGVLKRLWANSQAPTAHNAEEGEPFADGKTLEDLGWVIPNPRVLEGPDDEEVEVVQIVPLKSQLRAASLARQSLSTLVKEDRPIPAPPRPSGDTNVNVGVGVKCETRPEPTGDGVDLRSLPQQTIAMLALGLVPDDPQNPTPPSKEVVEAAIERKGEEE